MLGSGPVRFIAAATAAAAVGVICGSIRETAAAAATAARFRVSGWGDIVRVVGVDDDDDDDVIGGGGWW